MNDDLYSGGIDWTAVSGALPDAPKPNNDANNDGRTSWSTSPINGQHRPQDHHSGQHQHQHQHNQQQQQQQQQQQHQHPHNQYQQQNTKCNQNDIVSDNEYHLQRQVNETTY